MVVRGPQRDRFIIVDPDTGEVLDDAQGYGYKNAQKAEKAAWYKFKGGKEKLDAARNEARDFWDANNKFAKAADAWCMDWFKEVARGEVDTNTELAALAKEMGVVGFKTKFLDYL